MTINKDQCLNAARYNELMGICCEAVRKHMHTLRGKKESFLALQQVVRAVNKSHPCTVLIVCEVC